MVLVQTTNLWVSCLCDDVGYSISVSTQCMYTSLGPHVPDPGCGVSTSSHQDVNGRVEGHAVNGTEMAMVMSDHL